MGLLNKSKEIVLKVYGLVKGVDAISTANASVASGATPTKAEFDAVVALSNANKAKVNELLTALKAKNENA